MNRTRALIAGVLLVATLTSCVAPGKESEERDANGKKIEYVYYTPTGSNVPVKVRKDQLNVSDSDADAQQKALMDIQRNSAADQHQGLGGK